MMYADFESILELIQGLVNDPTISKPEELIITSVLCFKYLFCVEMALFSQVT